MILKVKEEVKNPPDKFLTFDISHALRSHNSNPACPAIHVKSGSFFILHRPTFHNGDIYARCFICHRYTIDFIQYLRSASQLSKDDIFAPNLIECFGIVVPIFQCDEEL
jgi:hypothetical protein